MDVSAGMLCLYAEQKSAPISQVMPIAFTAPLFGAMMGLMVGGEPFTWRFACGALLTVGGIVLLTTR
jgi:transporter family protein